MLSDLDLLKIAEEDLKWFHSNFSKIQEKYENKLIAIKNKQIVGSADNTDSLLNLLKERGMNDSEVLIEAIPLKNQITIFNFS